MRTGRLFPLCRYLNSPSCLERNLSVSGKRPHACLRDFLRFVAAFPLVQIPNKAAEVAGDEGRLAVSCAVTVLMVDYVLSNDNA